MAQVTLDVDGRQVTIELEGMDKEQAEAYLSTDDGMAELEQSMMSFGSDQEMGQPDQVMGSGTTMGTTGMEFYQPQYSGYAPARPQIFGEQERAFGNLVKEAFTGTLRSTPEIEALPDWTGMPFSSFEASTYSPEMGTVGMNPVLAMMYPRKAGAFHATAATGPEETMQIMMANIGTNASTGEGPSYRQDSKGNYIIYNPHDQKEYAYKPGFRASDAPRIGGMIAQDVAVGKGLGSLRGIKRVGDMAKMAKRVPTPLRVGAEEGIVEGTRQYGLEEGWGGTANPEDVAIGTGLSTAGSLVTPALKSAFKPAQYNDLMTKAAKGDQSAKDALVQIKTNDPENLLVVAEELGVMVDDQTGDVIRIETPTDVLRKIERAELIDGDNRLAESMGVDKETVDALNRQGMYDLASGRDVIKETDTDTMDIFDASSLEGRERTGDLKKMTAKIKEGFDKVLGAKNITKVSAGTRILMNNIFENQRKNIDDNYTKLKNNIPNPEVSANRVIEDLEGKMKNYAGENSDDFVRDGIEALYPFEKKVYLALRGVEDSKIQKFIDGDQITAFGIDELVTKSNRPLTYNKLDFWRRRTGDKMKDIVSEEAGAASHLYGLLAEDVDEAVQAMDIPQNIKDLAKTAKENFKDHKQHQANMVTLFGRALKMDLEKAKNEGKDIVGKTRSAISKASKGSYSDFEGMIRATPKAQRKNYVAAGVTDALMRTNDGVLDFQNFSETWNGLKNNPVAMKIINEHTTEESRKMLDDFSKISDGVYRSDNPQSGTKGETWLRNQVGKKESFLSELFSATAGYGAGAGLLMGLGSGAGMVGLPVATGAIPLALAVSSIIRRRMRGDIKPGDNALQALRSEALMKDINDFVKSGMDRTDIEKLSKSKAFGNWVKMAGIGTDQNAAERFIRSAIKGEAKVVEQLEEDVERREDGQ